MSCFEKNWKKRIQYCHGGFKLDKESLKQMKNTKSENNLVNNHLKQGTLYLTVKIHYGY